MNRAPLAPDIDAGSDCYVSNLKASRRVHVAVKKAQLPGLTDLHNRLRDAENAAFAAERRAQEAHRNGKIPDAMLAARECADHRKHAFGIRVEMTSINRALESRNKRDTLQVVQELRRSLLGKSRKFAEAAALQRDLDESSARAELECTELADLFDSHVETTAEELSSDADIYRMVVGAECPVLLSAASTRPNRKHVPETVAPLVDMPAPPEPSIADDLAAQLPLPPTREPGAI